LGFVETPEAMTPQTDSIEDYKARNILLERKVLKVKRKIHDAQRELENAQALVVAAVNARDELAGKLEAQEQRTRWEMKERFKYWEALTEARTKIEMLEEEIRTGEAPIEEGQRTTLCEPLPQ
jgi:chromosome segregation ATPase